MVIKRKTEEQIASHRNYREGRGKVNLTKFCMVHSSIVNEYTSIIATCIFYNYFFKYIYMCIIVKIYT